MSRRCRILILAGTTMSVTDISRVLPQFRQLSNAAVLYTKPQQFSLKYLPSVAHSSAQHAILHSPNYWKQCYINKRTAGFVTWSAIFQICFSAILQNWLEIKLDWRFSWWWLKVTSLWPVTSHSLLATYPVSISSRFCRNVFKYQATP
jgi:hypothetical protein